MEENDSLSGGKKYVELRRKLSQLWSDLLDSNASENALADISETCAALKDVRPGYDDKFYDYMTEVCAALHRDRREDLYVEITKKHNREPKTYFWCCVEAVPVFETTQRSATELRKRETHKKTL